MGVVAVLYPILLHRANTRRAAPEQEMGREKTGAGCAGPDVRKTDYLGRRLRVERRIRAIISCIWRLWTMWEAVSVG